MRYKRRDLVFARDPFKEGGNPRPWLIISDELLPVPGDLLCLACTRSDYPINHEITADQFERGNKPNERTFCSPWLLATLKPGHLAFRRGRLTTDFTNLMAREAVDYIETGK